MIAVAESLRGQLTMAIQLEENDIVLAKTLDAYSGTQNKPDSGKWFFKHSRDFRRDNSRRTFPATSDPRFTSVGSTAIDRFLRPICYQNMPPALLPPALADGNPLDLWRLHDSVLGKTARCAKLSTTDISNGTPMNEEAVMIKSINWDIVMIKSIRYLAATLVVISSTASAEDLSTASAPLPQG